MKLKSNNIKSDYLEDAFGSRGTQFLKTKPSRSFHIAWEDVPKNAQSLALIFIDYDAIPVCGFTWIHWTVANIDPAQKELPENASLEKKLLEGVSSWASPIIPESWRLNVEDAAGYGGCAPPDQAHLYTVEMFALNKKLDLKRGFYMNALWKAMKGHILDQAALEFWYQPKT